MLNQLQTATSIVVADRLNGRKEGNLEHELALLYVMADQHRDDVGVVDEVKHCGSLVRQHPLPELRRLKMHIHEVLQI